MDLGWDEFCQTSLTFLHHVIGQQTKQIKEGKINLGSQFQRHHLILPRRTVFTSQWSGKGEWRADDPVILFCFLPSILASSSQKHYGQKILKKLSLRLLLLVIYCWVWGLALRVICIPGEILLEKMSFSFVSSYQLEILTELRMRAFVSFPSQ